MGSRWKECSPAPKNSPVLTPRGRGTNRYRKRRATAAKLSCSEGGWTLGAQGLGWGPRDDGSGTAARCQISGSPNTHPLGPGREEGEGLTGQAPSLILRGLAYVLHGPGPLPSHGPGWHWALSPPVPPWSASDPHRSPLFPPRPVPTTSRHKLASRQKAHNGHQQEGAQWQ